MSFGSGTDPIEGASLAISILEYLSNKNILTISTTHYAELKNYALVNSNFENASCEFDINTLSPTYRLLIGVPGKSNAFAISKKLGLPDEILKNAKKSLNDDTVNIEELLKNIYDNKLLIEKEKEKISKNSEEINNLKESLENEKYELNTIKNKTIASAKQEAKKIILDAKEEANSILKEMENTNDTKKLNKLRKDLNNKLDKLSDENQFKSNNNSKGKKLSKNDIKIGLEVFIPSLNKSATIASNPSNSSNKVMVLVQNVKMSFDIDNLTSLDNINDNLNPTTNANNANNKNKKKSKYNITTDYKNKTEFTPRNTSTEINVIGFNVEEAIFAIDKFLDNAAISKLEYVRIVHGKGTGVLGKGIQKYLKNHPHVQSYRYGTFGEGEMGVTIVELKK